MSVLFESIRTHGRAYEYPGPSVAALESVLIRLYLESPVGGGAAPPGMSMPIPGPPVPQLPNGQVQIQAVPSPQNGNVPSCQAGGVAQTNGGTNTNGTQDANGDDDEDENVVSDDAQ